MRTQLSWRSRLAAAVAVPLVAAPIAMTVAPAANAEGSCPALYVLGIQGTGQSSSDADPSADSGMLAEIMRPLMTMADSFVERAYVPYPAGFGGAVAGGPQPFDKSVQVAVDRARSMTKQIADRCPDTSFAYAGYSQGAYAASILLRDIGHGKGPIPAERMAAASLYGNPSRPTGAPLFPGRPGATKPEPAPGTTGEAVEALAPRQTVDATGGGIGPVKEQSTSYGDVDGRVADNCETGDLACDAPADAPVTHIVANIVGQSKLDQDDPVQALGSIAEALAMTTAKTVVPVINEDLQGETLEDLSYTPAQTVSQRLATATDPRTPLPTISDALQAVLKVGTIGLNAVVTVAKKIITPTNLIQLGTVGLANPVAGLALLGSKVAEAAVELVPPTTVSRWTSEAVTAVKANVADNKELFDVANLVRYWNTAAAHGSYTKPSAAGEASTLWTAGWFASVAADLAGKSGFSAFDENGQPNADTEQGDFPFPTLPGTSTSTPTSTTVPPSTEEVPPWATGTVTISDTPTSTPTSAPATSSAPPTN